MANQLSISKKGLLVFIGLVCLGFILVFFSGLSNKAQAQTASLYLAPSAGTYTVGNTFSVELRVNSGGVAINASDGTLVFNPNNLEVKSLSQAGSVFSLWVQQPTFSNSLGTVNFSGGKPTPGFTGSAGIITTIVFKAKSAGTASVTFASGSVLADDGQGTNILGSLKGGNYNLVAREITVPPSEIPPSGPGQTPSAPQVTSLTHTDENKWYSNNNPELTWKLSSDITGVSFLLHKKSTANPGTVSDGLLESKKYENIADGQWYFHVKLQNQYGWGKITHRQVLIDTKPPLPFDVASDNGGDSTNPSPVLSYKAVDELSGIDHYEIKIIGEGETLGEQTQNTGLESYAIPAQGPGKYRIEVRAFDMAGNQTMSSMEIEIAPIRSPLITKYPERVDIGEAVNLEGQSLPSITNVIFAQQKGTSTINSIGETTADGNGQWTFSSSIKLPKGEYSVWAISKDKRGAQSLPSNKVEISVNLPPFLQFGKIALDYLTIMITFIVLIVGLVVIIFYAWYRITLWRKRMRLETKELAQSILAAFRALREEVQEQIEYLDGQPGISKEEKEVRDKLKQALDVSEGFISKELKDVEKELE